MTTSASTRPNSTHEGRVAAGTTEAAEIAEIAEMVEMAEIVEIVVFV